MMSKTAEQISYNMSRVKNKDTKIELILRNELWKRGLRYRKHYKKAYGKPDICFPSYKIAVFCDSEFWHGYNWEERKKEIKKNKEFWFNKIERNINRDKEVNKKLFQEGWTVIRFWENDIKNNVEECADIIQHLYNKKRKLYRYKTRYKTLDIFAGIGGIRRGFELTKRFINVLSGENDKYCCLTYKHLFGEDPYADVCSEEFKSLVKETKYDVLLAGFPCQAFSIAGGKQGFKDKIRGTLFFDIADILERTRPIAFLLENVEGLIRHRQGHTFKTIIETLVLGLDYHVVGVKKTKDEKGHYKVEFNPSDFLINSRFFGVPQNRPRVYIIGFDRKKYGDRKIDYIPLKNLPKKNCSAPLYFDLNDLLEFGNKPDYYLAEGYLNTLKKHRERHKSKGNGFGYIVLNDEKKTRNFSNAVLATGGSGKERNLIRDSQPELYGKWEGNKKTPINKEGIRVMTPREWGKLQGFIEYAFMEKGEDNFSFPYNVSKAQQYKQFGNAVTIPVIEKLAEEIAVALDFLEN